MFSQASLAPLSNFIRALQGEKERRKQLKFAPRHGLDE
jgi:hypothetical protein